VETENGCWAWYSSEIRSHGRPCLFLDRDGVVVEETNYLSHPDDVRIIAGVGETIARVRAAGWLCGIVTNQAGVGRGYYEWRDFEAVQRRIADELAAIGTTVDFVLACPYHPEATVERYRAADHPWRKPRPGMLDAARQRYHIPAARSIMVGDTLNDLLAGHASGMGRLVHVLTGHGRRERRAVEAWIAEGGKAELADSIADLGHFS
jgi:D-glycero-D-manno-heptose 1,7-bisphosphate phosphatase